MHVFEILQSCFGKYFISSPFNFDYFWQKFFWKRRLDCAQSNFLDFSTLYPHLSTIKSSLSTRFFDRQQFSDYYPPKNAYLSTYCQHAFSRRFSWFPVLVKRGLFDEFYQLDFTQNLSILQGEKSVLSQRKTGCKRHKKSIFLSVIFQANFVIKIKGKRSCGIARICISNLWKLAKF